MWARVGEGSDEEEDWPDHSIGSWPRICEGVNAPAAISATVKPVCNTIMIKQVQ